MKVSGGLAALVVLTAPCLRAQAPGADTLRLAETVRLARQANPMLRAAQLGARAAADRVGPAGAWPDPQLQVGLMNRMASSLGASDDPMTMNQVQLMQTLPWPGKLGGARDAARHAALAVGADAAEQERMLVARVRMTYYDLAYADRALGVMRGTQALLRQFVDVSTAMYTVGSVPQQDVLRAQIEVARMTEEITRMEQERVAGAARLNALLGRDPAAIVGPLQLPEPVDSVPAVDTLVARALASRPALAAGAERVAAAQATIGAARRELYPDIQLGIQYQQRPQFPDMVSLTLGASLPIFAGAKQLAVRGEMSALRDASRAELEDLRNETAARVIETRARAVRDRNLTELYRASILPQAKAAVESALAGYRVGRVSFMQLLDNQMTVNRYETETLRLIADFHQALGELAALTGESLEQP